MLVVAGFFLPWVQGDGVFALRTFSGFGLARDLHTITSSIETVTGGSLTPLLFYIAPAGAVGIAVYTALAGVSALSRMLSTGVGVYALALAVLVLVIAMTPVTDATRLLGTPSWGLGVTVAGGALLVAGGLRRNAPDDET